MLQDSWQIGAWLVVKVLFALSAYAMVGNYSCRLQSNFEGIFKIVGGVAMPVEESLIVKLTADAFKQLLYSMICN